MALVLKDRVRVTSFTGGSGTLTLGAAVQGFQDFSVIGDGNTTYYGIVDPATGDWEVGIGTYTSSGTTLSRDTILESSSGGTAVNFAGNPKDVFVTYPAERSVYVDGTAVTPAVASRLAFANLAQGSALSVLGVTGNATADNASIAASTDHQVLRRSGTSVAFGAVDLGQAAAITGVLPAANGGTGVNNSTRTLTVNSNSGTLNFTAASKTLGISNSLTLAGTDATTMTFPSTSATIARTDAGQTFTGTQVMTSPRIVTSINDTNGNEVFGITATGSAVNELTIANAATGNNPVISATGGDTNIGITLTPKGTGGVVMNSTATATKLIPTGNVTAGNGMYLPAANTVAIGTNGTAAITVDSSQRVGIGTAAPDAKLHVAGGDIILQTGDPDNRLIRPLVAGGAIRIRGSSGTTDRYLAFGRIDNNAVFSEAARITDGNDLLVGVTTTGAVTTPTSDGIYLANNGVIHTSRFSTDLRNHSVFFNPNGQVGSISTTGSSTAYNTSSDYRLKHDIAPMTGALEKVQQLNPVTYKWNADDSAGEGFIAHELQEVCPDAVVGEKDATEMRQVEVSPAVYEDVVIPAVFDDDGNEVEPERTEKQLVSEAVYEEQEVPVYQGVDTSFLVATLTAAIQELKAITDTQAQTISALEARIAALEQE